MRRMDAGVLRLVFIEGLLSADCVEKVGLPKTLEY
jgi:hypothetical protein